VGLTIKRVERLKQPGRYGDGKGLYLQVTKTGRSWLFRYEVAGREHAMGLGPVADVSLDDAREAARQARLLLRQGIDPLTAKRETRAANLAARTASKTFVQAADDFFTAHASKWKDDRFRKQIIKSVADYTGKILGPLPVDKIETRHVIEVLEQPVAAYRQHPAGQFWTARAKTARSTRERIEAILDFAAVRGWRKGENPARWRGHLDTVFVDTLPKAQNHPAMPYDEVPSLIAELRSTFTMQRQALEFCILTATRTGETLGAKWDEIDFAAKTWTIPASRMKADRDHTVPLSPFALELLQSLPRIKGNDHVFAGNGQAGRLSARSLATVLASLREGVTVHGFRSSFRDWAGEQTAFPPDVIEHSLAHIVGSATERSYSRSTLLQKRAALMAAWSAHCCRPVKRADVVVSMSMMRK
jgi:integrase